MAVRMDVCNQQQAMAIDPRWVRRIVRGVLRAQGAPDRSVSVAVVDAERMQALNARFLGHDRPTDVMAFPLAEPGDAYLGEVVVCSDVAVTEAGQRDKDPQAELALYLVHGVLHLLGFRDGRAADRRAMETRQTELLSQLGCDAGATG